MNHHLQLRSRVARADEVETNTDRWGEDGGHDWPDVMMTALVVGMVMVDAKAEVELRRWEVPMNHGLVTCSPHLQMHGQCSHPIPSHGAEEW